MARIIYSALVESIRGSIKGTTFQRNAYGFTVKGKPNMVNPTKLNQQLAKQRFLSNAKRWASISETNRAQWASYAENFPIPARLNPSSYLNAYNYFSKWHNIFNTNGANVTLADPGSTQDLFELDQIEVILSGGDLFVLVTLAATPADCYMYVYATPPIPLGREFVNVTPRFVGAITENPADTFEINVTNRYQQVWGTLPAVGEWIGLRLVFIRENNAQISEITATQYEVIV